MGRAVHAAFLPALGRVPAALRDTPRDGPPEAYYPEISLSGPCAVTPTGTAIDALGVGHQRGGASTRSSSRARGGRSAAGAAPAPQHARVRSAGRPVRKPAGRLIVPVPCGSWSTCPIRIHGRRRPAGGFPSAGGGSSPGGVQAGGFDRCTAAPRRPPRASVACGSRTEPGGGSSPGGMAAGCFGGRPAAARPPPDRVRCGA